MIKLKILYPILTVILLLGVGTFYYSSTENWSYTDSFYFSTMTLTTIGYGDLVPTLDSTKIFTSFYSIFGMGSMLFLIGSMFKVFLLEEKLFNKFLSTVHKVNKQGSDIKKLKKDVKSVDKVVQQVDKEVKVVNKEVKNVNKEVKNKEKKS